MEENKISKLYLLLDPLLTIYGSSTPALLLGKRLVDHATVEIVTPIASRNVELYLKEEGFQITNLKKRYNSNGSFLTLEGWFRNVEFSNGVDDSIIINFSQCFISNADIYYAPGPMIFALDDIYPEMGIHYKIIYKMLRPFILSRDKKFNKKLRDKSKMFIAVSRYCANLYREGGIDVEDVIYPPIDTNVFKPAKTPREDYILTYIGKESRFSILDRIAKKGVKIKGFGSKAPFIPSYILNNPNIELLGEVTNDELVDLYANALYTLFPFTHEPFGYIPVESMACSTPVLTYNKQGPSESVINNKTGWLLDSDEELIDKAVELWRDGYDPKIRDNCIERAKGFSIDVIAERWKKVIELFRKDNK